jgi:DNA-binding LacI/PurR family transcriptional regulator
MSKAPTQRDIAKAAGVCQATASLALRNHPSIPEATRVRIREVAESLGYRPNPRVAELMGHIRKNRTSAGLAETVALVWADASREQVQHWQFLQTFEQAARECLMKNGYDLSVWHRDPQMSLQRQGHILLNRGIRGVLLAPQTESRGVELDWKWSEFSTVIVGSARWNPEFNRVRFNHFRDMQNLVRHLRDQGFHRIGLVTSPVLEERSQHGIDAGFWSALPPEFQQVACIFDQDVQKMEPFKKWMQAYQPECLILGPKQLLEPLQELAQPPAVYFRNLSDSPPPHAYPGLQQNYTRLGEVAAEQLMAQLQLHQFGIPASPTQTLINGKILDPGLNPINSAKVSVSE